MTEKEEQRIFTGKWPWELPGLVVAGEGVVICNVPPMDRSTISKKAREVRDNRPDPHDVFEEVKDLSRPELRATIEMTRDELALRWAKVKELGENLQDQFEDFKDWISERLRDTYRNDPKGAEHPSSNLLLGYVRMGLPGRKDQWTHVKAHSHLGTDLRLLQGQIGGGQIGMFNRLAGRYKYLRTERMDVALGDSEPDPEEYTPSDKPKRILQAVAKLDKEREGLAEADSKAAIYRLVQTQRNGGAVDDRATNRLNQALRRDMERGGFISIFPETPNQLVELARTLSQRWNNVLPFSER